LIGVENLDLPERQLSTKGVWLCLKDVFVDELRRNCLWQNVTNDYGKDWVRIREIVLNRDKNKCQVCGALSGSSGLHVHHKIPFKSFSSSQMANEISNLITLCQSCHHRVEQNVKIRNGFSGIAFLLANLAPLYLMCDQRDIGYYSDADSNTFDKMPVIAIFDQYPGGIGLSSRLFDKVGKVIKDCLQIINECSCESGCPSCVGPSGENVAGGKLPAKNILELMLKA
jgi:DEAD/DEAH box helicase domain-containing protein